MGLIEQGKVGAVLVRSIDRLFRDESMIAPAVFAAMCKKHKVVVLTPDDMYDFHRRVGDTERFLKVCQESANFITRNILGVALKARRRKALRGEFSGHSIPTGFMLDDERRNYVPNPIWAPVMNRLLKRFHELDANFAQLRREVAGKAIFPDLPPDIVKRIGKIHLTKVPGGYTVKSHTGLKAMLINPALIGCMVYDGRIVNRNAHPAIVPTDDFWYAYNRLSATDMDGNPLERPKREVRYSREPRKALLDGVRSNGTAVITSPNRAVYVFQQIAKTAKAKDASYVIKDFSNTLNQLIASIHVSDLDKVFTEHLLERLEIFRGMHEYLSAVPETLVAGVGQAIKQAAMAIAGANGRSIIDNWQPDGAVMKTGKIIRDNPYFRMLGMEHQQATKLVGVAESIEETKQELARLKRDYDVSFDLMEDSELRANREARRRLAKQLDELERKQNEAAATQKDLQDIHNDLLNVHALWHEWDTEKKQRFIRLVTTNITLDVLSDGWLQLTVEWSPFLGMDSTDIAILWRQNGTSKTWTTEENTILQHHYSTANRAWLLEQLPTRSWQAMISQASRLKITRRMQWNDTDLPTWMSLEDKRILDAYGLVADTAAKTYCWWLIANINDEERS